MQLSANELQQQLDNDAGNLTFEERRSLNIKKNELFLAQLGIFDVKAELNASVAAKKVSAKRGREYSSEDCDSSDSSPDVSSDEVESLVFEPVSKVSGCENYMKYIGRLINY